MKQAHGRYVNLRQCQVQRKMEQPNQINKLTLLLPNPSTASFACSLSWLLQAYEPCLSILI